MKIGLTLALLLIPAFSRASTWATLKTQAQTKGAENPRVGIMFEPPAKAVQRELYATAEESADGRARRLALTLDASQTPPKPLWFVLSSGSRGHFRNERDDMFFKISLDGKLIKAVFTRMQVDAAGVMVANSGVTETQPDDVRTKELLRRETEFWLKGAGRKAAKR